MYGVVAAGEENSYFTSHASMPEAGESSGRASRNPSQAELGSTSSLPIPEQVVHNEGGGPAARFYHRSMDAIESLDYEVVENMVYRADQVNRPSSYTVQYIAIKWLFCVIIAIGTALTAFTINLMVENIAGMKFSFTFMAMEKSYFAAFLIYSSINVLLVLGASYVVTIFAPAAAGSGIPDVKAYLNGVDVPGVLAPKTLIGKIMGSIGSVAGGLAVGKEGPLVHTGSCIASLLGQGGLWGATRGIRWLQVFRNDRDRRDLVTCGAVSGVAAAFRAPVGGVLFALEEAASFWKNQLLWRAFFTNAVVVVVLRSVMKFCEGGKCGHFGSGGFVIFDISSGQNDYALYEVFPACILGVIGGLLGALFNHINGVISVWRRDWLTPKYGPHSKIYEACVVAFVTSLVSFCVPLMFECTQCPEGTATCPRHEGHYGNFVQFNCPDPKSQYNDIATIFFNTQDDAIRNLFSSNTDHEYSARSLITFLVVFFFLAVWTYGISVPSGLFVPCILCGASYGRLMGMFMVSIAGVADIDEGTYALLGAASFLAGAMRMTVSLCVILLELTNNMNLLPLIMLVLLIAKAVGDHFNLPVYDLHIKIKRLPVLEATPESFMRHLTAQDAANMNPVTFERVSRVMDIVHTLKSCRHNGFPVMQTFPWGGQVLVGIMLRKDLLKLLHKKTDFKSSSEVDERSRRNAVRYDITEFNKDISGKELEIGDLAFLPQELEMWLDMGPFVNPSPYIVQNDTSLTKVYNLFRTLGLRHVLVVPHITQVLGVITRKDILADTIEHRCPAVPLTEMPRERKPHRDVPTRPGGAVELTQRREGEGDHGPHTV